MLRVPVPHLEPGDLTLDAETSRYVARVHRLREGASVLLFHAASATEATAKLVEVGRSGCAATWDRCANRRCAHGVRSRYCKGRQGGQARCDRARCHQLGVTRVVAVESKRSVVRLGARGEDRLARWTALPPRPPVNAGGATRRS